MRGLQSSPEGKRTLRAAYKDAGLTQEELANQAHTTIDTIKRLLGTKDSKNGVDRWVIENVANVLGLQPTDIVDPKDWNPQMASFPPEFKSLIDEKIRNFCGRQFVFEAFNAFIKSCINGYFTLVGDAGMGKSAIAAKYVSEHSTVCYFNVLAERRNRPELFLKSIRQQLIQRYELLEAEQFDLATLLAKASQKLPTGESLIIVVDALDEVEQEAGGNNLLDLPRTLPNQVYFILTRRPYTLRNKRLFFDAGVAQMELDLTTQQYREISRGDVKEYINLFLNSDPNYSQKLKKWIQARNYTSEQFIEEITEKSESNFMYLRYVLPAIAEGLYDDLAIPELPQGLQEYYQTHWVRMGMETERQEIMVMILFILVEIGTPIPCEMIADIADQDESEVGKVLEGWREYLSQQEMEGEICYGIYHASFLQFLSQKRELKRTRKLFREVNQRIVDYYQSFHPE